MKKTFVRTLVIYDDNGNVESAYNLDNFIKVKPRLDTVIICEDCANVRCEKTKGGRK